MNTHTHTHTHTIWIPWLILYLCKPGHGCCQYMVSQALISRWVLVGNLTLSLKARSLESSAVWRKVARRSSHNRQVAASQWPRICQLACDLIFIILLIMLCALCLRDQLWAKILFDGARVVSLISQRGPSSQLQRLMAYERSRSAFTAGPVGSNSTPNNKDWVVIRSSFQEVNQEAKAMIANPSSDANIYHCELRPLRLDSLHLRRPDHRTFQDSSKGRHLNASPRCRNPGFGSHTLDASSERPTGQYHIQREELKHKPLPLEPLGALEPQAATIVHKSHWWKASRSSSHAYISKQPSPG